MVLALSIVLLLPCWDFTGTGSPGLLLLAIKLFEELQLVQAFAHTSRVNRDCSMIECKLSLE